VFRIEQYQLRLSNNICAAVNFGIELFLIWWTTKWMDP